MTTLTPPHEVVRASAGTGKTYALATRYLKLLRDGASPDTILATTFTRKAAGEILERILVRLAKAAQDPDEAAQLADDLRDPNRPDVPGLTVQDCQQMLATVCRSLHRVWVSTLDSLFYRMAMCYRYELGLPPQPRVVETQDPAVAQLRLRAIEAILADNEPTLLEMIRRLEHGNAPRRVTDILNTLVSGELYDVFCEAPNADLWQQLQTPPGLLAPPTLAGAINAMRDLSEQMPNKSWAQAHHDSLDAATQQNWKTFLGKGIAQKIVVGEEQYNRRDIPADVAAAYQTLIDHAHAQLIDRVAQQTQATHRLLERFDQHFTRLRYEHGVLLYSDIPLLLSRCLSTSDESPLADLYYRLDTRVTHLLLDEFQDTSIPQWEILRPFAQEIRAYGDGSRTFYCVGDTKQAIYAWRGGCAEIFDHIEDTLKLSTDTQHRLNKSYRSSQVVLDTVNRVFSGLADNPALVRAAHDAHGWQARFQEHTAHHTHLHGYVELITSPAGENGNDNVEENNNEDDGTAPLVATAHDRYVADRIAAIYAQVPGRTIGVLVNQNQKAHLLINLLHDHHLPASGEGADPLTDDAAVGVILSALTLADHPGHTAAGFHVRHSPLGPTLGLESEQPAHVATVARRIRQSLLTHGYADLITQWGQHLAPSCDERNTQRLTQLIELAQHHDAILTLRPKDFVTYVQSTGVEEPRTSPIRVMTINKAKGLEFDIIVLPELQRTLLNESGALVYTRRPSPTDAVTAVYRGAPKEVRAISRPLEEAYQQRVTRQLHDDLSKLYVAMTRARHALHMIIEPLTRTSKGQIGAKGWSTPSFAAILRHALCETEKQEEHFDGQQTLYTHGHADWMTQGKDAPVPQPAPQPAKPKRVKIKLAHSHADGHAIDRSWRRISPSSLESAGRVDVPDLLATRTPQAQQRGSLIHTWFEQIAWLNPPSPNTRLDDDHLATIASRLFPEKDRAWVNDQIIQFRRMLEQPAVIETFSLPDAGSTRAPQPQLWRERSFAVRVEDHMLRGKFDRVVIHTLNGQPTHADLIDFKTDRVTPDTLGRAVEQYQPQMEAYRQALSILLALPPDQIRTLLLFVDSGQAVDLPQEASHKL